MLWTFEKFASLDTFENVSNPSSIILKRIENLLLSTSLDMAPAYGKTDENHFKAKRSWKRKADLLSSPASFRFCRTSKKSGLKALKEAAGEKSEKRKGWKIFLRNPFSKKNTLRDRGSTAQYTAHDVDCIIFLNSVEFSDYGFIDSGQ